MVWKSKLIILSAWVVVSAITYVVVSRMPSIYRAEAVIVVDSQKIPERYVSSTVVSDVQDRLAAISKRILSSGRLQQIIQDFNLYRNPKKEYFPEESLQMMRNDLEITSDRSWNGRPVAFRIAYNGPSPTVVAQVVNRIANLYVEENLKTREGQAIGTSEFIEAQLKEAKETLDFQEAAVSRYKLQHNGELPQQEGALSGMLSRLQMQLEANRDSINRAHQSKVMVQDLLSVAEDAVSSQTREAQSGGSVPVVGGVPGAPRQKASEQLQARLDQMRLRYSDEHPDVKRLVSEIARTKAQEEAEARNRVEPKPAEPAAVAARKAPAPAVENLDVAQARARVNSLKAQLAVADQELDARQAEQRRILHDISVYQTRVNNLPVREQELAGITRDYEITKGNYRSLLDKKIAAEMASNMEQRQQAERFTIADPARIPALPIKPKRLMLYSAGSMAGLLLGLVLGLAMEFRRSPLLGEWELPSGVTILGRLPLIQIAPTIPAVPAQPVKRGRKAKFAMFWILAGTLATALSRASYRF